MVPTDSTWFFCSKNKWYQTVDSAKSNWYHYFSRHNNLAQLLGTIMLVKILDADGAFVEALKVQTGEKTASKAYQRAAHDYEPLRAQVGDLLAENAALRRKVLIANQVIEGARSAAALLLDKTSQQDFDL